MERQSLIDFLGIPDQFGMVLLVFSFILLIAPYLSGMDLGIFKIPSFSEPAKKNLRVIGPVLFVLCVGIHVPSINRAPIDGTSLGIETIRIERPGGGTGRGFFTPKGYLVAMTETLRNSAEVTVVLIIDGEDRRESAQVVKRGKYASLLKLKETGLVRHKFPIRISASLNLNERVERYVGPDDITSGTVLEVYGSRNFSLPSGPTTVSNALVTTTIALWTDSGAPVVDTDGRVVAMVYGGSLNETVSIPIERIKRDFPEAF